jgi:hypothetical protein
MYLVERVLDTRRETVRSSISYDYVFIFIAVCCIKSIYTFLIIHKAGYDKKRSTPYFPF